MGQGKDRWKERDNILGSSKKEVGPGSYETRKVPLKQR